ncbi:MAG: ABC transporter permease [Chloroflexi bacterium RBG_16_57_11]|nr:MAG: ABC transporter permease [Chloroflexi bacterium RBG_16_57_11]
MKAEKFLTKALSYFLLGIMLVITLFPLYWILVTSFKTLPEIYTINPRFWPSKPGLHGYETLFEKTDFILWVRNSAIVALIVSVGSITLSIAAAYGLSRFRFKGKGLIGVMIFIAYLLPEALLFIPIYILMSRMGLSQRMAGLIFVYPSIVIPYATWVLTSYFRTLPVEIEEAALIDGCSRLGVMRHITLPLASPGVISTFIFSFTLCWSEYIYALVILSGKSQTLPLGLSGLIVGDIPPWNVIMAGAIMSSIPIVILYLISSKYIVTGLTLGGVK